MIGLHLHRRHLFEVGIKYFTPNREWGLGGKRILLRPPRPSTVFVSCKKEAPGRRRWSRRLTCVDPEFDAAIMVLHFTRPLSLCHALMVIIPLPPVACG
jgi:hypothetical protein